jgi:hypothetical protein
METMRWSISWTMAAVDRCLGHRSTGEWREDYEMVLRCKQLNAQGEIAGEDVELRPGKLSQPIAFAAGSSSLKPYHDRSP